MLQLQEELDTLPAFCPCCHVPAQMLRVEGPRSDVHYLGLRYTGKLQIPVFRCGGCSSTTSPSPFEVGCFPSTPCSPHIWYDQEVFAMYQMLGPGEGTSATGA